MKGGENMQGSQMAVQVSSPIQSKQLSNNSKAVNADQGEGFKGMIQEAIENLNGFQLQSALPQQLLNIDQNLQNSEMNWDLLQSLLAQNNGYINNVEVIDINLENAATTLLNEAEVTSLMQQSMPNLINAEGKVILNPALTQNISTNNAVETLKVNLANNQTVLQNNEQISQDKLSQQTIAANGKVVLDKATMNSQLESLKLHNSQINGNTNTVNSEETKSPAEMLMNQKPELLNPDKIHIKVGDGNLQAENKQFANQMADKILFLKNGDKNEITLQLMPKELGKVTIRLVMEGNMTQVFMTCSNSKAQNLLSLNAEGIRNIVETNTGTNVTVSVNEENKLNHQREAFDGRGEKQSREQEPEKQQETLDEDSAITFVNQLRLGLLNNTLLN